MYCPKCGQQQASDAVRFCSRCGFLLEGTAAVLATGG
ncbi:MAG TPA: zinc ribbon domain-containing protein, partial [Blastocatellia bacterium]|nr:zinc ribbon domain-containing protein [Blastocatellia bacterium]